MRKSIVELAVLSGEHRARASERAVADGTVLYWGRRVVAQRMGSGDVRFRFGERWVDADAVTAATFVRADG